MLGRQRSGSVVCRTCGRLVGVNDARCWECGARNPSLWGWAPAFRRLGEDLGFTQFTIGACVFLYLVALLLDPSSILEWRGFLRFLAPSHQSNVVLGMAGFRPVFEEGRWWTVLSAGWLHGGIVHIFLNMYWVRLLAAPVARLYGPGRMVIIYVTSSVAGFIVSSSGIFVATFVYSVFPLAGVAIARGMGAAPYTLGASAALMGLLGAMIHYGRRGSSEVSRWAWGYVLFFFIFGLVASLSGWGIDNWAHLGGFGGGWLAARVLDPLKPERIDHLVVALLLLLACVAAIVVSVITGLPYVRT